MKLAWSKLGKRADGKSWGKEAFCKTRNGTILPGGRELPAENFT